ncbi:MAG: DNA alkylation repair protein [Chloroflexi bacterium]|nr:DNA alkylation repair protein [Chloroflexota bacterium]
MTPLTLEQELSNALNADDFDALIALLAKRGSGENALGADPGTAKVGDIALAAKLIRAQYKTKPTRLFDWAKRALLHADFNANELGLVLVPDVYTRHPEKAQQLLLRNVDSANWAVREYGGVSVGRILNEHFDDFFPVLQAWTKHTSENVRRAVVIATMEAAKQNQPKRGAKLLKLIDPLMDDDSRYVRVNLGPFAISLALLKNYPELTLKFLDKHAKRQNEFARWNVAMVWSAFGGRKYAKDGVRLLHNLAADERRFVWRAVASATAKLGKAKPEVAKPLLKKWKADPARKHVAEVAERYL